MPALKNAKHEHFAQLVSNGESAGRAYVLAGYSEKGARQSAHALLTKSDVSDRLSELRRKKEEAHAESSRAVMAEAAIDKAWVLKELVENVKLAKALEPVVSADGSTSGELRANLAAANKALELIGKEIGMFIDRKEVRTGPLDGLSVEDLKALDDALGRIAGAGAAASASGVRGTAH